MYKDRIPHQVFSVILNTASLILETLQLVSLISFLIFRFPQLLMIIVDRGDLRSSSLLHLATSLFARRALYYTSKHWDTL